MIIHNSDRPSAWVERFASLIPASSVECPVLDLACGQGRHSRFLVKQGHHVLAIDRDSKALDQIASGLSPEQVKRIEIVCADLEGPTWPLESRSISGLVVTNYLYRPRLKDLLAMVAPQGVLIYETFAMGNEVFGKPSNPDFLLKPHELLDWILADQSFQILGFEQGIVSQPQSASIARICAVRSFGIPLQLPL